MCAAWASNGIPAARSNSRRRGEDEAKISTGLFCRSILRDRASLSTYVNSRILSKTAIGMLGANLAGDSCDFRVWAPLAKSVTLRLSNQHGTRDWPMRSAAEHFTLQTFARVG